jgi:opacity protein-like surface antigen
VSTLHSILSVTVVALMGSTAVATEQAATPTPKLYLAVGAAWDSMPDRDLDFNGRTVSSNWEDGWGALAAAGYRARWFRTEIEFSQREAKMRDFNNTSPWIGTQWDYSLMVNAFYDFHFGTPALQRFVPYIGAGFGGAHISWGNNLRSPKGPTIYDAESTKPGWQGIVGASLAIRYNMDLALDFRIKGSGAYTFPGSAAGTVINNFNYLTHTIFLTFRYGVNPS